MNKKLLWLIFGLFCVLISVTTEWWVGIANFGIILILEWSGGEL